MTAGEWAARGIACEDLSAKKETLADPSWTDESFVMQNGW